MKGFILAAGFGTRMAPLTKDVPKAMIPVATIPSIHYMIQLLAEADINEIFINLHYLGSQIEESLGDGQQFGVKLIYSHEPEILGTGGALRKIVSQLQGEPLAVVNADTLFDLSLKDVIESHKSKAGIATMVLRNDPQQAKYGLLEIDQNQRLRKLLGQTAPGDQKLPSLKKFMFAAVHILEHRFLEYIPPDINTCIIKYAYSKAIQNNEEIYGYVSKAQWRDLGNPELFYKANQDILDRNLKLHQLDPLSAFTHTPKKEVDQLIRLGKDVVLGEGVLLQPPVLIADRTKISEGASIGPNVVIGKDVLIGKKSKIKQTIIFDKVKVSAKSNLDKCILSKNHKVNLNTGN